MIRELLILLGLISFASYVSYRVIVKRKREKEAWDDLMSHKQMWKREDHTGFSVLYSYNGKWILQEHDPFAHKYDYKLLSDEQARVYKIEAW